MESNADILQMESVASTMKDLESSKEKLIKDTKRAKVKEENGAIF